MSKPRRSNARPQPRLLVLSAGQATANPANPCDPIEPRERRVETVRILGGVIGRHWEELVKLQEAAMDGDFVTVKTAAERLGISEREFYRFRRRVGLATYKMGAGRIVRYKWSDIEKALEEKCRQPAGDGDGAGPSPPKVSG